MLDEPPLIVRIRGSAGSMDDSSVTLQSERSQCLARGLVIRVTDAMNSQTFRDLDEQRLVIDIDNLLGWHLGDVQRKANDVRVGITRFIWRWRVFIIVAIGFARIPTEPPHRNAEVSLAPCSLSLDVWRVPLRDRRNGGMRQRAVARTSFPPVRDRSH